MNKFLITGATGFIGKNLAFALAKTQAVRILVRKTSDISLFRKVENIEISYGNLENGTGLDDAVDGIDVVIHAAAKTYGRNLLDYYRTNTQGTANLITAMKPKAVKKIIYLSSQAVCSSEQASPVDERAEPIPVSFYGLSKKRAEELVIASGLQYIIIRPCAVYGPYDTDLLKYLRLLNQGLCPVIGSCKKDVSLIYVQDLVKLITKIALEEIFNNRIYFVSDGRSYSLTEIVEEISKILRKARYLIIKIPESLALFCGLLNDLFLPEKKRLIGRDKVRELARQYWVCSNERVVQELGFKPAYLLAQGMAETIEWYKREGLLA